MSENCVRVHPSGGNLMSLSGKKQKDHCGTLQPIIKRTCKSETKGLAKAWKKIAHPLHYADFYVRQSITWDQQSQVVNIRLISRHKGGNG